VITRDAETDFDLHGVVGIRLLDAGRAEAAAVRRQLGPLNRALEREPDITIRFVDEVTSKPLTVVGLGVSAYNADGFFVSRGHGAAARRTRIAFPHLGERLEIVCERGIRAIPHLLAIINLTALAKGVLPLHASAFTLNGTGVLVTGWAKAGKTEALLACMEAGADYVGDEWVYLTPAGDMLGLPEPIRLWSWHLQQLPGLLQAQPRRSRVRLAAWHRASEAARRVAAIKAPGADLVSRAAPAIGRQAYLQIPPVELFGQKSVVLRGRLDAVVLVTNHDSTTMTVEPVAGAEVARRMSASLVVERAPLLDHYQHFRFAFPQQTSEAIETAQASETRLLAQLFDGRPAARVSHPYPCEIAALGQAVIAGAATRGVPAPGHLGRSADAQVDVS
jgi:hypothetical protein